MKKATLLITALSVVFVAASVAIPFEHVARAAPEAVTINRYYCEWHDAVSTTNTTATEIEPSTDYFPMQLTFIPPETDYYLVIASAILSHNDTGGVTTWDFLYNGSLLETAAYTPRAANDALPVACHREHPLYLQNDLLYELRHWL